VAAYREAIRVNRGSVRAHYHLGWALESQGDRDGAAAACREALTQAEGDLRRHPAKAEAHLALAWVLATAADHQVHDPRRAVEHAKRVVELAPHDYGNWLILGLAHYRAGDWAAAAAAADKAAQLRPGGDATTWLVLALAHGRLGDRENARTWYAKAARWMDDRRVREPFPLRLKAEADGLLRSPAGPSDALTRPNR
jgi:tetratricopeptide (TPR) repeat protein